jgi:hypothetical protein
LDIYQPVVEEDIESQVKAYMKKNEGDFNEWLLLSGIRRPVPIEEKDGTLVDEIKHLKEQKINHLILGEPS